MTKKTFVEIIKFASVGGSVSLVHLAFVYLLTNIFGVWYLVASTFSYACAIVLNFFLQKFFVREHTSMEGAGVQFSLYVLTSLIQLALNALCMYLLVTVFMWQYLVAQALIIFILSVANFFINRHFIFR